MDLKPSDVVLVNPTDMGEYWQLGAQKYFFPLRILYLKDYLRRKGIPSCAIDLIPDALSPDAFRKQIETLAPRIVGFTGDTYDRHRTSQFITGLKRHVPDVVIVVGGPHFSAIAEECLSLMPDIDVVVRGEGEITLHELVMAVQEGRGFEDIVGITFRGRDGRIVETGDRPPSDRDECEIDPDFIPNDERYSPFVSFRNFEDEKTLAIPILVARGCTNRCTFCYNRTYGRFKARKVEGIVKEVEAKREKFGSDNFWMIDPTFTLREKYAFELCKALAQHCPGIRWTCDARADCNPELVRAMAEAGCVSVAYALESGSPKVLKAIRKELDVERVADFAKLTHDLGMRGLVFVMYSMPEETYEDFRMTMDVLYRIKPYIHDVDVHQLHVLPGTELERQARELGVLPSDFSWCDPDLPSAPPWAFLLSREELDRCKTELEDFRFSLHHSRLACVGRKVQDAIFGWARQSQIKAGVQQKFPGPYRVIRASAHKLLNL
jgi:radical SAM superfamily enzyme YgiQ (UPF0313 family)